MIYLDYPLRPNREHAYCINSPFASLMNDDHYARIMPTNLIHDIHDIAGKYSSLVIILRLKRDLANKIAGVFTPSLLIVMITFTSFWLGPGSISDRITIGITAFLAVVTQFADVRKELPPISYVSVSFN